MVGVDPNPPGVVDRLGTAAPGPHVVDVVLELAGVGGAHDDLVGLVNDGRVLRAVLSDCPQRHQEAEEPLVRVGLALLPHVVGRGLAEVELADGGLLRLLDRRV